ncbi:MAG TPA: D-aminoacyl-tRNA deacylase, partial [Fimbriimonadaceae bacterium]|nr:D-aminoacyl-tRNA deacylase [Fimbriimonadaceae bacterium]
MRAVVQRVSRAEVLVDGRVVGRCGKGLLVLVGAHRDDAHGNAVTMADRVYGLRVFNDGEGKMNRSLRELQDEGE